MAKRSATETAAVIDILRRRRMIGDEVHTDSKAMIVRVVSMLVGLVAPQPGRGTGPRA